MMTCEECGRSFITRWGWFRHIRNHHPETHRDDWEYRTFNNTLIGPIEATGRIRRDPEAGGG